MVWDLVKVCKLYNAFEIQVPASLFSFTLVMYTDIDFQMFVAYFNFLFGRFQNISYQTPHNFGFVYTFKIISGPMDIYLPEQWISGFILNS
jgi:hypothetical protein